MQSIFIILFKIPHVSISSFSHILLHIPHCLSYLNLINLYKIYTLFSISHSIHLSNPSIMFFSISLFCLMKIILMILFCSLCSVQLMIFISQFGLMFDTHSCGTISLFHNLILYLLSYLLLLFYLYFKSLYELFMTLFLVYFLITFQFLLKFEAFPTQSIV